MHLLFYIIWLLSAAWAGDPGYLVNQPNCVDANTQLARQGFEAELVSAAKPSPQFETELGAILDNRKPAKTGWQKRVSELLDEHYQDPQASPGKNDGEKGMAISGYWTLNAAEKVATLPPSAEQRARAFERFGKLISKRTVGWNSPWHVQLFRNEKGDYLFMGAIHCLVILNEPQARVFKGGRPEKNQATGERLEVTAESLKNWDPRADIGKKLVEVPPKASEP